MPKGNETERRGRGYRSRLTPAEQDALDALARSYGYEDVLIDGLTLRAGVGFVLNILSGEIATVLLGDKKRRYAIRLLEETGDEVLTDIAAQLRNAAEREQASEDADIIEAIEERRSLR